MIELWNLITRNPLGTVNIEKQEQLLQTHKTLVPNFVWLGKKKLNRHIFIYKEKLSFVRNGTLSILGIKPGWFSEKGKRSLNLERQWGNASLTGWFKGMAAVWKCWGKNSALHFEGDRYETDRPNGDRYEGVIKAKAYVKCTCRHLKFRELVHLGW